MADDRARELLASHMEKAGLLLSDFLDTHGVSLAVLNRAMEEFTRSVIDLPKDAACKAGCAWCCHLRVGVSIPELLVIHGELLSQATPEGLSFFKDRILDIAAKGDVLDEDFWRQSRTPCPFLNEGNNCLIYPIRPFACRAHHSLDEAVCREGHDQGRQVMVPCFPLYRAFTDLYASVFIKVLGEKGFPSYQVGLVKGLAQLFQAPELAEAWFNKEDVFAPARISPAENRPGPG